MIHFGNFMKIFACHCRIINYRLHQHGFHGRTATLTRLAAGRQLCGSRTQEGVTIGKNERFKLKMMKMSRCDT